MCTVTVVPVDDGFRMVFNRDEQRDRPPATPPARHRVGERTAVFPIDPLSGGTWIGVNDRGLVGALLNRTLDASSPRPVPARSRGLIVPALLECDSLASALDAVARIDATLYDLFRIIVVQRKHVATVTSDGRRLTIARQRLTRPLLRASSRLGDALVDAPRRALFESRVLRRRPSEWLHAQTGFHRHRWRNRSHVSVVMERAKARTVSRTVVRVTSAGSSLRYHPISPSHATVEEARRR
jgi:uncharacterized protein with NRDE domain